MTNLSLTLLVPVHNEEQNVQIFLDRVIPVLASLPVRASEIVFINNASTDATLSRLVAIREKDPRVKILTLARNVGYQCSLVAGLSSRQNDLYAIVDVDGEDPPELLGRFFDEIQKGAQTVYGIRSQRDEAFWITAMRGLFYWINKNIADAPIRPWMAEFVMITKTVRDAILANKSTYPFLRAAMGQVGLGLVGVPYYRESRRHGVTHYNFFRMTQFAVAGFLSSSTFPLRAVTYISLMLGLTYIGLYFRFHWTLAQAGHVAEVFGFFYLLTALSILSLYMARTYKNGSGHPLFTIDPNKTFL